VRYATRRMSILRSTLSIAAVSLLGLSVYACGSSAGRDSFTGAADAGAGDDGGGIFAADASKPVPSKIEGKVYAPNGTLPISGALVYVTKDPPADIPDGAFCDKCITLPEGTFAYSQADGSFSFTVPNGGEEYLVVQKGQFRRVRKVTLEPDTQLDKATTTLPGHTDVGAGDNVPKMLVLQGSYDKIEDSLGKLGITELTIAADNGNGENRKPLLDANELAKYHVIFIPCSDKTESYMSNQQVKDNLANWVNSGGKLYVTDWSYEYARQPFPPFIHWAGETASIGSAATLDEYDAPATAVDQGLGDWLKAVGFSSFDVQANWTTIDGVDTLPGKDEDGNDVMITPKVWVEGTKAGKQVPTTVSYQQQCGRVMFSTYHTESGSGTGLTAQEDALLHVLLEVGVCVGQLPGSQTQ
jgi:hypothetical protein